MNETGSSVCFCVDDLYFCEIEYLSLVILSDFQSNDMKCRIDVFQLLISVLSNCKMLQRQ